MNVLRRRFSTFSCVIKRVHDLFIKHDNHGWNVIGKITDETAKCEKCAAFRNRVHNSHYSTYISFNFHKLTIRLWRIKRYLHFFQIPQSKRNSLILEIISRSHLIKKILQFLLSTLNCLFLFWKIVSRNNLVDQLREK